MIDKISNSSNLRKYLIKEKRKNTIIFSLFVVFLVFNLVRCVHRKLGNLVGIIIYVFLYSFVIVEVINHILNYINQINYSIMLLDNEYNEIDMELMQATRDKFKNNILMENYFMDFNTDNFFKFSDVIFLYNKTIFSTANMRNTSNYVYLLTLDGLLLKVLNWTFRRTEGEGNDIYELLTKKCSNALVGKTKENINFIRKNYNFKIK